MAKYIIQFNEANFDLLEKYSKKYSLPNIKKLIDSNSFITTNSEKDYKNLEPWIQWYSFYTGLSYDEHKVFHLGDSLKNTHNNFLKKYSYEGKSVGIFGGMNLPYENSYEVFIPDAWTETNCDQSFSSRCVNAALKSIVNSNARLKISLKDIFGLIFLIGVPKNLSDITIIFKSLIFFFKKSRASLASYFDYFFLKYSLNRAKNKNLDISLIFLNGFAHVQHHYMFTSQFIKESNPSWYVSHDRDLLLESLIAYDKLFGLFFNSLEKDDEYFVLTGLTQEPYKEPFIYWRLRNCKEVLSNFIKSDFEVNPRMTRDFEVVVNDENELDNVLKFLEDAVILNSTKEEKAFGCIEKTSNNSVFASFIYKNKNKDVSLNHNDVNISLEENIDFIALKNAGHDQRGWLLSNKNFSNDNIDIWDASKLIF